MVASCNHDEVIKIKNTITVLGEKFMYDAEKCLACHETTWTSRNNVDLHRWLLTYQRNNRDRFIIQKIRLPQELWDYLNYHAAEDLGMEFKESILIRAATSLYFRKVIRNVDESRRLDELLKEKCGPFVAREGRPLKVAFNPQTLLLVNQWSEKLGQSEKELVEQAVARILCAAQEEGEIKRALVDKMLDVA